MVSIEVGRSHSKEVEALVLDQASNKDKVEGTESKKKKKYKK